MKYGTLFIVPTPIGNLADITFRAVEVLESAAIIGAEDTRNSIKLLNHYNITTKMISYHKFNERKRVEEILDILQSGADVAIISDAGTPGISDPAGIIINEAISNNIKIEVLPGATSFIPALIASGLNIERFHFIGFLPEQKKKKDILLEQLKEIEATLIFFEAPKKLKQFLKCIYDHLGDRKICIVREISKIYETYYRTTLKEALKYPEQIINKGEFVIVVDGFEQQPLSDEILIKKLSEFLKMGYSKKTSVNKICSETGENKNRIYNLVLKL
ncbi:MAG: 16S rRNA (cytidine(1402)-2'-O)-methyltransferase [Candidatus Cloacimonetes bacterium]|nr:16S rRNA (cytidine(1402)-2'-O)-methyltransferase [Candidatus Cloacimonadota bacterium]